MKTLQEVESTIKAPADKNQRVHIVQVLQVVETVGIEPTSKNISGRISPSAAGYLILPARRHTADSMQTIPLGPLTLTGGRVRGFLHK